MRECSLSGTASGVAHGSIVRGWLTFFRSVIIVISFLALESNETVNLLIDNINGNYKNLRRALLA